MSNPTGWIKLHRKLLSSAVWDLSPLARSVWVWLLLEVDHRNGTIITSLNRIARGVSYQQRGAEKVPNRKTIKDILDVFVGLKMIKISGNSKSNSPNTTITICNWKNYQAQTGEKVTAKVTTK